MTHFRKCYSPKNSAGVVILQFLLKISKRKYNWLFLSQYTKNRHQLKENCKGLFLKEYHNCWARKKKRRRRSSCISLLPALQEMRIRAKEVALTSLQPALLLVYIFMLDFISIAFFLLFMASVICCVYVKYWPINMINFPHNTIYHAFLQSQMSKVDILSYNIISSSESRIL